MQASQTSGMESTNMPGPRFLQYRASTRTMTDGALLTSALAVGGLPREAAHQNMADAKVRLLLSADQGDLNLKAVSEALASELMIPEYPLAGSRQSVSPAERQK